MKITFTKMSGAGNDFVVVDNREGAITDATGLARKICDRRWGVGADGLLLLERSENADYRMMYYNADGSYGGMCGNGGRCISRYALDRGIASDTQKFEALGHIYHAVVDLNQVILSMLDPKNLKMNIVLPIGASKVKMHFVDTGSPHVVIPVAQFKKRFEALDAIPVTEIGRKIRHHKYFQPNGTNVNFIEKRVEGTLRIRTYERGVEAETLACGTGSIAAAIVGSRLWKLRSPIQVVPASGIPLTVGFDVRDKLYSRVTLKGEVKTTFSGEFDV
jgi:diaminopimelate epimerase